MFEINFLKNRVLFVKNLIKDLKKNIAYEKKKNRIIEIKKEIKILILLKNTKKIKVLKDEKKELKIIYTVDSINKNLKEIIELLEISIKEKDNSLFDEYFYLLKEIEKKIKILKLNSMFIHKDDKCGCYIDIQSGSGGNDAQDWANMLMRMYIKWAENKKFNTTILQENLGEISGIKSVTLHIKGKYAYGWLKYETGIHRLVRKSPFNSSKQRHTSFSSVFIYPDIEKNINITINPIELRIDVYRASGAGGQHVNRTESAVRITHIPTNIVTQSQKDRSQHKNKSQAMKQMKAKLYKLEINKQKKEKQDIEKKKSDINWGNQIRSYVLDDSRIRDLRTGIKTKNISSILNGNLDIFLEASLKKFM